MAEMNAPTPSAATKAAPKPKKVYVTDRKEHVALFLAWILGILAAELLWSASLPGLGVTLLVAAWYGVLFWYRGLEGFHTRPNILLFAAVVLLALTFSLFSSPWFRLWNTLALCALMTIQLFQWSGAGRKPWSAASMAAERLALLLEGLFCRLGAGAAAVKSLKAMRHRKFLTALLGLAVALPILLIVVPLLTAADSYFALVTQRFLLALQELLGTAVAKVLLGLLAAPFLFSLLYTLRRPEGVRTMAAPLPKLRTDPLLPAVVLAVMDLLYVYFLAIQSAALFGGSAYLEHTAGLTYAEYARSGFFQLVFVAALNLTLVLAALHFSRREEKGWRAVQVLASALVALSCVLLLSAAYRMTLYVAVYGLSFKRFLTYWGMVMLAIFFVAALLHIWRREFSFFQVFFVAAAAGWLVLNFCNVDYLVARYNVAFYQRSETAVMNLDYLAYDLSYDALAPLEALPGDTPVAYGMDLSETLAQRRAAAARAAGDWRTWSVSAQLAAVRTGRTAEGTAP